MPFKIDGQFRQLDFKITDPKVLKEVKSLISQAKSDDQQRAIYNMLRSASIVDGDRFTLQDNEAALFLKSWKTKSVAPLKFVSQTGGRVNRVYNQVGVLKKHWDFSIPVEASFFGQPNKKVYFKIDHYPIIEAVTDRYGRARVEFFPEIKGVHQVYASTKKEDLTSEIKFTSPQLAMGKLNILEDKPTIAVDIVGLVDNFGLETSIGYLDILKSYGYQLVGITPYDDLHAQDRLDALFNSNEHLISVVHNSFRLSDYFETDLGRQEFLAEYLKHMAAIRGIPLVAGVGFSKVVGEAFKLSGLFDPQDILIPDWATPFGKGGPFPATDKITPLLFHFESEQNLTRFKDKVGSIVAKRDSDIYKERMSWLISTATATPYTDGNDFAYFLDHKNKNHNNAAFEAFINAIRATGARGALFLETYAWHSDEQGLTLAMLIADKAFKAKFMWNRRVLKLIDAAITETTNPTDKEKLQAFRKSLMAVDKDDHSKNPKWRLLINRYIHLIKESTKKPGNKEIYEKRKALFQMVKARAHKYKTITSQTDIQQILLQGLETLDQKDGMATAKLLAYVNETPRVPIYLVLDKTTLFEYAAASGYHDGRIAMDIFEQSGLWMTVVPTTYGYKDKDGVVDPLYHRYQPFNQLIPCKHTKFAVFQHGKTKEWFGLGGGRHPGTKMFGPSNYKRHRTSHFLEDLFGRATGNFEDDTFFVQGPAVHQMAQSILTSMTNNFKISARPDTRKLMMPSQLPSKTNGKGDNRIWTVVRYPWKGISTAAMLWHAIWNNAPEAKELTIVNSYSMHPKWEAELKHLLLGGSAGVSQKTGRKITYITGGNKFVVDSLDKFKTTKIVQLIQWLRELRDKSPDGKSDSYEDPIQFHIVKRVETDPRTGKTVPLIKTNNQQIHNKIYIVSGDNEEDDFAFVGNLNLDDMSFKDKEDIEVVWGPATTDIQGRANELKGKSVHINAIPGVTKPRSDGTYLSEEDVYNIVFEQLVMEEAGKHLDTPSSLSLLTAIGRMGGTVISLLSTKIANQPTAYGLGLNYIPTVVAGDGFENYHRLDVNLDFAKYYGMHYYFDLLIGASMITSGADGDHIDAAGLNLGLSIDSLFATPRKQWDSFDARFLGVDLSGSLLFMTDSGDVGGSFRLGVTPVSFSFRKPWSRWEATFQPVQLGLMSHFGDSLPWPGASFFLGSNLTFRYRDLPPLRDGDFSIEPPEVN